MKKIFCLCSTLFLLLMSAGPGQAAETTATPPTDSPYTLTVIPFYSPEKLWALYSPLITYLKRSTGQPWELKLYHDHDTLIEGLCKGDVAIALLGPVPMGRANRRCWAKPVLVALDKGGDPFYRSVIVTNDPSVTSLAMLKGKKFGLFKGSTAAHILPLKMLKDAGLGSGAVQPIFFEGQDRIMTALLTREITAAGMKEALYRKFEKESIKPLKMSDPLPNFALTASPAVNPQIYQELVKALLVLKPLQDPADGRAVRDWDDEIKNGFMLPDADFLPSVIRLHNIYQEIMHEAR
ncbi:MAG: PhnD/SsuA/transferrin family substrate-binding protein [Nitrospirota bacterium]|nr:PhnD/SsuA/transferrin family substrate-binding protein [Nitrospirota bacterium]